MTDLLSDPSDIRSLSKLKLNAALEAHRSLHLQEIQELPLATQQTKRYMLPLLCSRTGLIVGTVATITVAGHVPLLGQWKNTQVLHPFFSLGNVALLQFARNSWLRFCALTALETTDTLIVEQQELQLRVATLAMLHNLTDVRQDVPWLPAWQDVMANWTSLLSICYWRAYLDSQRFKFPSIRISKLERDFDLRSFLQICWESKKRYESNIKEQGEEAKQRIAEKAMKGIIDDISGKKPLSSKILWRWFESNMPTRYKRDLAGWMSELFFSSEKDVKDFTVRDIELFEEIFLVECPTGSSISHAFLNILRSKHQLLTQHLEMYEILDESQQDEVANAVLAATPEPKLSEYSSRALWFRAKCAWELAQPKARKYRDAEKARQKTESVNATFKPRLIIGAEADEIPEIDSDSDFAALERETPKDSDEY